MEDDLFYDLFGEDGFLTPKSPGSTDHDSGQGSPFESTFDDASPPPSFAWDTADHPGEFWGNILDDLPSDITDDSDSNSEQKPLHQGKFSTVTGNYNETLSWSTKVLEESTNFDCSTSSMNFDDDWNLHGNVFDDIKQDPVPISMEYATINNCSTMPVTPIRIPLKSESPVQYDDSMDNGQNEIQLKSTPPIAIKPVNATKAPTWVVKTSDIKSHFQLGQNIIAIIQNVKDSNGLDNDHEKASDEVDTICNDLDEKIETPDNEVSITEGNTVMHHIDHDYADKDLSHITQTTGVSQGMGPGLMLTDEEKKLLELEGLKLPDDAPLTKEEEKVLKKVRRKIKNKQSAMESRRKRKEYIDNLERRVKHCTDLNNGLRKKVDKLSKENKSLVNQLKVMKEFIGGSFQETRTASTGTCLAVLLLSFALFVIPFNPLNLFDGKSEVIPAESSSSSTPVFRSRTLLAIEDNTDYFYQDEFTNSSYMSHNYYFYEPPDENVQIHFERGGKTDMKTNISMYMYRNFTWYSSTPNNENNDHYITF